MSNVQKANLSLIIPVGKRRNESSGHQRGAPYLTGQLATSTSCAYMSLTRSTFAGGQRYCSYMWSTLSEFNVLLQQIISGVSAAASGISS